MAEHWRLAIGCGALVSLGAAVAGAVVWGLFGAVHAGAFAYGAGVGVVSLVSVAGTVSLLSGGNLRSRALGVGSFPARYLCVAAALGLPAYWEAWPVLPMAAGVSGVYLVENLVLVPGFMLAGGRRGRRKGVLERRVAA
ncbi:hypothetical protein Rxycam_00726 [Rubrobacter xylanophilus DSM 9941]|nr:hypothetical protein Rxycam_00726 [Rubrobacter xylanophilus DSM 9941]